MRRTLVVVIAHAMLVLGCGVDRAASPRVSGDPSCGQSTPPASDPATFTSAAKVVGGATFSPLVACAQDGPGAAYVTVVPEGAGTRSIRLLRGAIRCKDGSFREVDGHAPVCDLAQPPAAADAAVFADSFFGDVAAEWAKDGISIHGMGLLSCKNDEPMIALGDFAKADRAAAILVTHARLWGVRGPINLVVRGVMGACQEHAAR